MKCWKCGKERTLFFGMCKKCNPRFKERDFVVALGDLIVTARSEKEAQTKAEKLIKDGEVKINFIEEN